MAAVPTVTVQTGLGSNGGDGSDEMTVTALAQAWLVIRWQQQRDNGDCGGNGGGANLDWFGGSGKTATWQQN